MRVTRSLSDNTVDRLRAKVVLLHRSIGDFLLNVGLKLVPQSASVLLSVAMRRQLVRDFGIGVKNKRGAGNGIVNHHKGVGLPAGNQRTDHRKRGLAAHASLTIAKYVGLNFAVDGGAVRKSLRSLGDGHG